MLLVGAVPFVLVRVSGWSGLARRWQPRPGELREGDRFLMATVVANGVSIPSTVVATDAGIWLSPHLLSAGLFPELFLPWRDVHRETRRTRLCLVPVGTAAQLAIRPDRAAQAVRERHARSRELAAAAAAVPYRDG